MHISIHALLAESDYQILAEMSGATRHFYPRSPCGERRINRDIANSERQFLSTLSLRRATIFLHPLVLILQKFLSTLSLRRATSKKYRVYYLTLISIHALLAESDLLMLSSPESCFYFYPRSPCGERRRNTPPPRPRPDFYPRSPCGERR